MKKPAAKRPTEPPRADVEALLALYKTRRYAEAENRTRALLGQYPEFGFGWKLLGGTQQAQGKDALPAFQKALELMPGDAEVHYNFGTALKSKGQFDAAATSYRRAIEIKPDFYDAHSNLAYVLKQLRQFDAAEASCRRVVELNPKSAIAHNNLGSVLQDSGQLDAALASYRRAAEIKPDFAEVHSNLGNVLNRLGQFDAAMTNCRRAIEIKPDFAGAYNNLGVALKELGQFAAAQASYQRALQIKPDYAVAHNNLGNVLKECGQLDAALASYRKAVEFEPDYAEAHSNLSILLKDLGQTEDALASNRRALELQPDYVEAQTNLLFLLNATSGYDAFSRLEEARKFGRMASKKAISRFSTWQCATQPERLRVGIVSGDLHNHPVGYALKSLLEHLDSARVELIAYSTNHQADEFTALIKPYFAAWKPLYGFSDEAAARLIHAGGVHVLLDLSGHTGKNRLSMFAWKPALVQASWLGYFATTGVAEMDYLLTSEAAVPEAHRGQYTETVWYLPDTWMCFTPPDVDLPVANLPALQNGHITFGCFQRLDKVGEDLLPAWARILAALPGARLSLACKQLGDPALAAQFAERLQRHGIDPARVTMRGPAPSRDEYLARYAEVDVMLDSFPYPGVTTTCEALWMGVPTITLAGDTLLSRQGAGVLTAAGLGDWVVTSVADYIDKAVALAGDVPKLAALRAGLREQVSTSPLFDAQRFARNFEDALWGMWQERIRRSNWK
jgi:protein O-GlcNAc transferase